MARHKITHGLDKALALKATRKAIESYAESLKQWSPEAKWVSDDKAHVQFTVLGQTLKGVITVDAQDVELVLDVPLMFRAFQGAAIDVVDKEINTWIARARAGDLD